MKVSVAGQRVVSPTLVGRDEELELVVGTVSTPPALVLIEGEAGIGKTRLLYECLRASSLQDRTVLVATCPPLREPFPLGPVIDGLRRLSQQVADIELSPLAGALRPLFPEWADQLPPVLEPLDDPKETRHRLLRALTELVERLNVEVLVIEDAHWADAATLEWLLTLTSAGDHGMSIVITYRPTDVPEDSLLLRLTSRLPTGMGQLRVHLEPLDVEQTRQLIGSMFGADDVSEKFAAFLRERADGIPLAIEESVRLLRDRYDIVRHDGQWTRRLLDELEVPPTVRDSVLERVARLPAESRQVLEAAAVLAEPADEALLTAVAGLDGQHGEYGVAAALASGLLREASSGRFMFRHVLDAQAVSEAIPASQRRHLHARAAEALRTAEPAPVARLARHFREAGDTEAWCHYGEASADLALESGDDKTAVTMLHELLTKADHPGERRARLARKLGDAACYGGAAVGDLAERVPDTLQAVLADSSLPQGERGVIRLLLGRLLYERDTEAAVEVIEAALPDLAEQPVQAARAMLALAMPLTPDWPAARHLEWLERATDLLPRVEPDSERLAFIVNQATALLLLGQEEGWQVAAELPRTASSALELNSIAYGMLHTGQIAITWGRYGDARSRLALAVEIGTEADFPQVIRGARVAGVFLDWYTGAWSRLADTTGELAEAAEAQPDTRLEARVVHGLVDVAAGHRQAAERQLREVGEEFARRGLVEPHSVPQAAALGRLRLADGESADALQVTAPVVTMIARKGVWVWATDIAPVHVDALIAAGEPDQAAELVDRFAEGIEGRDAPAPAAALVLCRAIVTEAEGDHDKAAELFAKAAAAWAALPRPYDELLALERQGLSLLAAGERDASDREQALAVLTDAEQRLRKLGAKWDADRVARLLRQHGVEVSRAWKRGPRGYGEQLSPRELEVLALVARGMTNREAGEVLFLSPKTVGVHLGAAMRKLGVSSRTAAAMAATEAGLISADENSGFDDSAAN